MTDFVVSIGPESTICKFSADVHAVSESSGSNWILAGVQQEEEKEDDSRRRRPDQIQSHQLQCLQM